MLAGKGRYMDMDDKPHDGAASRQLQNSGEGCRQLAQGSLDEAALSTVPNLRHRLENSAATWTARAEMLERLGRKRDARLASGEGADAPEA